MTEAGAAPAADPTPPTEGAAMPGSEAGPTREDAAEANVDSPSGDFDGNEQPGADDGESRGLTPQDSRGFQRGADAGEDDDRFDEPAPTPDAVTYQQRAASLLDAIESQARIMHPTDDRACAKEQVHCIRAILAAGTKRLETL